jgi:hypothetical protein
VNTRDFKDRVSEIVRVDSTLGIPLSSVPITRDFNQPFFTEAIDFSPDGTLYGGGYGGFIVIDPMTGVAEFPTPGLLQKTGENLDFGLDGVLRSTRQQSGPFGQQLTTIELETSGNTAVGALNLPNHIVALASRIAVPEPASALLAIVASIAIGIRCRLETP